MLKEKYTFEQWCNDNNFIDLLKLWDYELNDINPNEIECSSTRKIWFKCPRGLHDSRQILLRNVVAGYDRKGNYRICKKCNSIGQYMIDNYGKEYADNVWSKKNNCSYFEISRSSGKEIWLKCLNDNSHPDYNLTANNFHNTHGCPYCAGQRVCLTNSFGHKHPEYVDVWSNKNTFGPFDRTYGSRDYAWFKCENNIHDDYKKRIRDINQTKYICPECAKKKAINNVPRGENSPQWRGGVLTENRKIRNSPEYAEWRLDVFKKDWFTCQCCGSNKNIQAHHIKSFSENKDLRLDVTNGICLCELCHHGKIYGSFHNLYGTHNNTPEQLEEYINLTRKSLGIDIPFSLKSYLDGNIIKPGDIEDQFEAPWIFDLIKDKHESNHAKIVV